MKRSREQENKETVVKLTEQSILIQKIAGFLRDAPDIDNAIYNSIELLGRHSGVDRVFFYDVFRSGENGKMMMTLTHEWVLNPEDLQFGREWTINIPLEEKFHRWIEAMLPKSALAARPSDFNEDELAYLDFIGVEDLLFVPVFVRQDLWGIFGMVSSNKKNNWTETQKNLLMTVGNMIEMFLAIQAAEKDKTGSLLRFKLLADNTGDMICLHNYLGEFTYLSPSVEYVLGYFPQQLIGKNPVELVHTNFKLSASRFYLELGNEKRKLENIAYQFKKADGTYCWLETSVTKYEDAGEKGFITVSRDITARKAIELELEESENKLKSILNAIDDIIYATDFYTGKVIYINSACTAILHYSEQELMDNHSLLREIIYDEDRANVEVLYRGILEQGVLAHGSYFDISYRIITKTGEVKWVNNRFRVRFNKVYNLLIHEGSISDVSQQMMVQNVMLDSLKKEKALNDMKNQFIAYTSHQFKTPISAIISSGELLQNYWKRWDDEKREKHISRIISTGQQLAQMITDLTTLEKIEGNEKKGSFREISLHDYLTNLLETLSALKKKRQKIKLTGDTQTTVFADEDLLYQIFENILTNAVKFTPEGGTITISVSRSQGQSTVSIADTGIGVPDKEMDNLFEPFYRANNAVGIAGSGLGLTIAGRALRMLGGSMSVRQNEPRGMVFTVSFHQFSVTENSQPAVAERD